MPKWGLSMTEGRVVDWLVDEGAEIAVGDEVAEVETEKINGVGRGAGGRRAAPPGGRGRATSIPVGGLLGVIADATVPDAEIDAFVAEFQASFVPGRPRRTPAPAPRPSTRRRDRCATCARARAASRSCSLHGFGGDLDNWLFNADGAGRAGARCYALDLPGPRRLDRRTSARRPRRARRRRRAVPRRARARARAPRRALAGRRWSRGELAAARARPRARR